MTKERLFELVGNADGLWDDFDFRTNVPEKIGIIILDIIPAVRGNEEWRIELGAYLEFKNIGCYNPDNQGFTLYGDGKDDWFSPETQMLLGYELKYCREILKQEAK